LVNGQLGTKDLGILQLHLGIYQGPAALKDLGITNPNSHGPDYARQPEQGQHIGLIPFAFLVRA